MNLRIALAQMDVSPGQPEDNLRRVEALAEASAQQDVQLLLLPELWLSGFDLDQAEAHARAFEDSFRARWATVAKRHGLYIAGSVLAPTPDGRPANTALVVSPEGETLATYRKVHLFEPMGERTHLASGETFPTFDLPWGRTALAICYDLRFPEQFRPFALAGVLLVLLPAQWPLPRLEHWRILLRARAIENQFWLAACNRVGRDPGGATFAGHSAVISPWGEVIVEGAEERALLLADLDLDEAERTRRKFPVLGDRRQDLYKPTT